MVHPYGSTDTATAPNKSFLILSDSSDFHTIDNLSITFQAFARRISTLLSVDEMFLLMYVNLSTNFRGLPFKIGDDSFLFAFT